MVVRLKQSSKGQDEEHEKGVMKDGGMKIVVIAQFEALESFARLVCWLIC